MQPYHFSMFGLALDIVGAFLVAVEAIKLHNLRILRDRWLRRLHTYTLSPRYYIPDENGKPIYPPVPSNRYAGIFMGLHYVAGLLLLTVLDSALNGWLQDFFLKATSWVLDRPWYLVALFAALFIFFGVIVGLWMVGELVHMTLTWTVESGIKILDFIDARTPDGTVGVIGFVLLFAGFSLQMYGTYAGSQPIASKVSRQQSIEVTPNRAFDSDAVQRYALHGAGQRDRYAPSSYLFIEMRRN